MPWSMPRGRYASVRVPVSSSAGAGRRRIENMAVFADIFPMPDHAKLPEWIQELEEAQISGGFYALPIP